MNGSRAWNQGNEYVVAQFDHEHDRSVPEDMGRFTENVLRERGGRYKIDLPYWSWIF
jgi:hypothetical protein